MSMTSWPMQFRLLSFIVTMGVTLTEFALVAIPVAVVLWLFDLARLGRIVAVTAVLAAMFSLSISITAHLWPRRYRANARIRGIQ